MTTRDVADTYVAALARTDADAAAIARRPAPAVLPMLAPDAFDDRVSAAREARAALSHHGNNDDRALALVLSERLDAEIDLVECGFTERLLAPLATPIDAVRSTFDELPHGTDTEWEHVIETLHGVAGAHDDYLSTLVRSAGRGHVVAARQVAQTATRCRGWVEHDDFYGHLAAAAPPSVRERAVDAAASASSATLRFADEIEQALLPVAPASDAVGHALYTHTARAFLGYKVDLLETYDWGWSELDRIAAEADVLAHELHAEGFDAAVRALDSDPTRRLSSSIEVEQWLTARMATIADLVDGRYLELPPEPLRRPECRMASAASGVMYYAQPDPAMTRPGRVWWTVDPAVGARTWREATTLHHEGVPGHHTQIVTAMTTPALHPWQRHLCQVHGHAEGWAHWVEAWCAEVGLLDDPAERLGMLIGQAWRAARIVIDMGIHLDLPIPAERADRGGLAGGSSLRGARRWSYDVAVDFLRAVTGLGPTMARFEVDRYLGWPAQALAFRVGAREFESIRVEARRVAGSQWDERAFLTDLLRLGPMGLGPLRTLGRALGQPHC